MSGCLTGLDARSRQQEALLTVGTEGVYTRVVCSDLISVGRLRICYTSTQAFTVILKGLLEDSRSFNRDPPHLTLNHGFPVIQLSRQKYGSST